MQFTLRDLLYIVTTIGAVICSAHAAYRAGEAKGDAARIIDAAETERQTRRETDRAIVQEIQILQGQAGDMQQRLKALENFPQ